jgi:hypothetical protein
MVIFVSDLFIENYVGGGELTSEAIVKSSLLPVFKINSRNVSLQLMKEHADKFWVFGNFADLSEACIMYAIKNLNYANLEYDYKYCIYRSPEKHIAAEGRCDCHNQRRGKLVSAFYKKSKQTWFMSEKQKNNYVDKFPFLDSPHIKVLNSVFSDKTLDFIETLDTNNKNDKWLISNSPSWIKGTETAVLYAKQNNLEYELVWGLEHKQLLEKMAKSKGVIYLPPGGDTCPRFIIEAKMLDCELILNDNVQHKDEEWFETKQSTINHMRCRTHTFWSNVELDWNINTPPATNIPEKRKFNIVVPFYNCEPWILKCLESIENQRYSNFHCFVVDDMSTDNSAAIIEQFVSNKNNFTFIKNVSKKFALANIASVLNKDCVSSDDVDIILDGDDWFSSYNVLSYLNEIYVKENILMTYGTYIYYPHGTIGIEPSEYPSSVIQHNSFRQDKWRASHLRTFKHNLWLNLNMEDLKDKSGNFYQTAYDQALMLPLLEMSSDRSKYIDKILHVYNRSNPLNVDKVKQQIQYQKSLEIRNKKPYVRLP